MRIVVTGATGNVGTSVVRALSADERVREIVGVARRLPGWSSPRTQWVRADVSQSPLEPVFAGADAVIHLAWLIQPSRDEAVTAATNVEGSQRVFAAVTASGVPALVYASSIGAYSPGPKDRRVGEDWPTAGIPTSFYSRHKAAVERALDQLESDHPELRAVRLRPGLVFKREAASGIRRLFAGPLLPSPLLRPGLIGAIPDIPRLALQAVHADDLADAYRLAALSPDARGAYNVAAEPVLDVPELARLLGARPVPARAGAVRALADASWKLRLQPTPPGWLDMGLGVPMMDVTRAREQLGWVPRRTAGEALLELMEGMRAGAGLDTPPLSPGTGGTARVREFLTGLGAKSV